LTENGLSVTSRDSAQADDEVEIPDEPDRDDDDPGEAMSRERRPTSSPIDIATPKLAPSAVACPLRPLDRVDTRHDLSPYLRFCRLLI
jgi:hypothetical protein